METTVPQPPSQAKTQAGGPNSAPPILEIKFY